PPKIALGLKQLTADPWSTVSEAYSVGQVLTGRVTRLTEFGAFVELAPGIEALAHASTFPPAGRSQKWSAQVPAGTTGAFEILSIEREKKRIGVALLPEGSARAARAAQGVSDSEATTADSDAAPQDASSTPGTPGFGSLADKLRGALGP